MNNPAKPNQPEDFWLTVIRTALGHCPNCGEALGHIRADDGPAWLTILLAGHILAPFLLGVVPGLTWPDWEIMGIVITFTLVLTLATLPRAKGFFIGAMWRWGGIGVEK